MKTEFLSEYLKNRKDTHQLRHLRTISAIDGIEVVCEGKRLINFCSNNYLGLADHPLLKQRAIEFTQMYGTGAGASRLVCGNYSYHMDVEVKLASLMGSETALIFNSGYQANATLLPALADRHSLILADKHIHNSLLQGAIASQATLLRYRHNDLNHLSELLTTASQQSYSRVWIVTESIFGMDGDQTAIDSICALAHQHNALLYVDDAHSVGIAGHNGMGLCAGKSGIDIIMGTFGKAGGAAGAFAACSFEMREYLIQACAGVIYSTAMPPGVMGAIDGALDLIPKCGKERDILNKNTKWVMEKLDQLEFNTGSSTTPIIPLCLGTERAALAVASALERQGILALAIRPPTVPAGSSRIRLSLSALHTPAHLEALISAIEIFSGGAA